MSGLVRAARPSAMLALMLATSCVGPKYQRPKFEEPASFRFASGAAGPASLADLPWWEVFHDEALKALLKRALVSNFDLRIAIAHVDQARAQARAAWANFLPGVGVSANALYSNGAFSKGTNGRISAFAGGPTVSWEPDVFGSVRRAVEEAKANALASEQARRGVWLTVLADVADDYFTLLSLDVQHNIALRAIAARQQTLALYRTQLEGGVGTGLQVTRAEADVASAQATLASLEQQIAMSENAISFLLGLAPGPIARPAVGDSLPPPPEIPAGLPSTLLTRRPDVLQAEAQVIAANAEVGVRTAALFPSFSLTAQTGLLSLNLASLVIHGWEYLLLGGINWTAPILQGSALRAQLDAAKAAKTAAVVSYEQAAFAAFREVADALVSLQRLREERAYDEQQVKSLERAVDIARTQFRGGTANYLDVVSAQENAFAAELSLAQLEGQQILQFVQLYRALGGGWWVAEQ